MYRRVNISASYTMRFLLANVYWTLLTCRFTGTLASMATKKCSHLVTTITMKTNDVSPWRLMMFHINQAERCWAIIGDFIYCNPILMCYSSTENDLHKLINSSMLVIFPQDQNPQRITLPHNTSGKKSYSLSQAQSHMDGFREWDDPLL